MHPPRSILVLLLAPLLALGAERAAARDATGPSGAAPAKNFSNIHDEVEWVTKTFATAERHAAAGAWAAAVRTLQPVIDDRMSRETPLDAAPYVRAVYGSSVYEGAWLVARQRIARGGDEAIAAYEREFGATALALLRAAVTRRDMAGLQRVAARFLPLAAARRAALLSIDLALERSDEDGAIEWIEALKDVEAVSAESKEHLAPWRAARIRREVQTVARNAEARDAVAKALATADPADDTGLDPVPTRLLREAERTTDRAWPTTGGNAARSARTGALGHSFRLRWFRAPSADDDLTDTQDPERGEHDRPSVWLPPRAVATPEHLFVSDGQYLHVYDLATGIPVIERDATEYPGTRLGGIGEDSKVDRRLRFGLLEGHALSLHRVATGWIVLAAVPDGRSWDWATDRGDRTARDDHLQAFRWNGKDLSPLWRAGGTTDGDAPAERALRGGLPDDTRLYGAPVFYRERVWVAGVRPARATNDRWEVWLYSLAPTTGHVLSRTHLGTGTPMRAGRMDEVIPSSPAAAHGRVVVSTSLGIIAAVNAADGRIQWIHRYGRGVETERGRRRNRDNRDLKRRTLSFVNEPPILAFGRCFVAPTDSHLVLTLFDRPVRSDRQLVAQARERYFAGALFMPEQIAGVARGTGPPGTGPPGRGLAGRGNTPASLILIGKGESASPPGPMVVAHRALGAGGNLWPDRKERALRTAELWSSVSPTGFGAEPYGRALVTDEEVFVPQAHGIAIYELRDRDGDGSHFLGVLDRADMDAQTARLAPPRPYGNLIPIPGRGLVAVSTTTIAFWERTQK